MELYNKSLNREKLQEILDCFVEVTGIRAAYFDNLHESIIGKEMEPCEFCKLIRKIPAVDNGCKENDAAAFNKAREAKGRYLYKCHVGLWEAAVPLFVKNTVTGFLMIGQVKGSGSKNTWKETEAYLERLQTSHGKIEELGVKFLELPEYNMSQIKAAAKMLEIIAQNIIASDIIHIYDSNAVEKAREYIKRHFRERIPVKALAAELGLSPASIMAAFKRETGTTMTKYAEALRMDTARELLLMTSLSVKEIAFKCGFEDQNYFSRVFKREMKLSPVKFREANKK